MARNPDDTLGFIDGGESVDDTGRYPPKHCIVCDEPTRLRCGRCRKPICHHHEECPNGCDATPLVDLSDFGRV